MDLTVFREKCGGLMLEAPADGCDDRRRAASLGVNRQERRAAGRNAPPAASHYIVFASATS